MRHHLHVHVDLHCGRLPKFSELHSIAFVLHILPLSIDLVLPYAGLVGFFIAAIGIGKFNSVVLLVPPPYHLTPSGGAASFPCEPSA